MERPLDENAEYAGAPDPRHTKYAHVESERRFLVRSIPDGVVKVSDIADRYLDGSRLRLRAVTTDGVVTRKLGHKVRLGSGPERIAHTSLYLDDDEWALLSTLPGRELRKRRHLIVRDGCTVAVDEFEDGTLVAEIDGGTQPPTRIPAWLDILEEVTGEERWTGGGRAR